VTTVRLDLEYDGSGFRGWARQPGLRTVQGVLEAALAQILREEVLLTVAGRTDTGVHALGQVASFTLQAPIPPNRLQLALNRCLPPSIRVLSAELVPSTFHARHSALRKTYEYRIFPLRPSYEVGPENICSPILAPFVWPCPWPLSLDALNRAAIHVTGTHDFSSFAASDPDLTARNEPLNLVPTETTIALTEEKATASRTPIRTITQSEWHTHGGLFVYRVTATGFLHHMVRNLVGTFVQCGASRVNPDSIPTLLAARDRSVSGPTAPPTGLFLVSVEYAPIEMQEPLP